MAYKLIDAAQARWRAVNAPHLVALVRAGAIFHKGKLLERPSTSPPPNQRINRNGGRLKHPHPQALTISPILICCAKKHSITRTQNTLGRSKSESWPKCQEVARPAYKR